MARINSLMEWIDQTKKVSKCVDYVALDMIDSIMKVRQFVDRRVLYKNRRFFKIYCERYHKPNPLEFLKTSRRISVTFKTHLSTYVCESIKRVERLEDDIEVQWFEIIDFIYERPELVDPSIMNDQYVKDHISSVCADNKKNNPLQNGMVSRLGKYWRDSNGQWKPERRKRF